MAHLYLHIPFAPHLGPYDDAYAEEYAGPFTSYVQGLVQEMAHYGQKYDHPAIETLSIGGGVPSLLHIDEIARLLEHVFEEFDAGALEESSIEVSPEHAAREYLSGLRALGFNRVNLRLGSFFQDDLDRLERPFNEEEARASLESARRAGFENVSVDLALGIPDQSHVHWAAALERLTGKGIPHLSLVELTDASIDPEEQEEKYRFAMDYLQEKGYEHYEISHFALPGRRSRHNQASWQHENMLGLGASAHSFWWKGLPAYRWRNIAHTRRYQALLEQRQAPIEHREALSLDDLAEEHIMLRLRTAEGLDLDRLEADYGIDLLTERVEELAALEAAGLIEPIRNQQVRLTNRGKLVCDSVTGRLLPDATF